MLIAHLSDFHVFADWPETLLVRADAVAAARKVVADVVSLIPKPDAVCITGDLTDGGSPADYERLKGILSPIDVPVFVVPGNHDRRQAMRASFDKLPFASSVTLQYEAWIGDTRILALDTMIEGHVHGQLDADQLRWLDECLQTISAGPTFILMHHPPFPSGMPSLDATALRDGCAELEKIIRRYPGVLRILSGHIHRPYQAIWNGAFCAVAGSPAFQIGLDLQSSAHEPGPVSEPYAYFLHGMAGSEGAVMHTRYVTL